MWGRLQFVTHHTDGYNAPGHDHSAYDHHAANDDDTVSDGDGDDHDWRQWRGQPIQRDHYARRPRDVHQ